MRRLIMIIAAALALGTGVAFGDFTIEIADDSGDTGMLTETALDSQGRPGICYYNGYYDDLMVAERRGGEWQVETVDHPGYTGKECSIAYDDNDEPHVAYQEFNDFDIKYAYRNGEGWHAWTVAAEDYLGFGCSLAFADNGKPRFSYLNGTNQTIGYVWGTPGEFSQATVGLIWPVNIGGLATSLVSESAERSYIAAYDETEDAKDLLLLRGQGEDWEYTVVDDSADNRGWDLAMAQDGNGVLHIAYYDQTNGALRYAWGNYDSMQTEQVDDRGWCGHPLDIAVEENGTPHVCYYSEAGVMHHAYREGGNWFFTKITEIPGDGLDCSIVVDADGLVTLAYYDSHNGYLKVARGTPPAGDDDDDDDDDDNNIDDDDDSTTDDDVSDDDAGDDDAGDDDAADDDSNDDDDTSSDDDATDDDDNDDEYRKTGSCDC